MREALFYGLAILVGLPAAAVPIRVSVAEAAGSLSSAEPIAARLAAQPVATAPEGELPPKRSLEVMVPGELTVEIEPATWRLELSVEGFWSGTQIVRVEDGDHHVRFDLWPVGTIRAQVAAPSNEEPPDRVQVRFAPAPRKAEAESLPSGDMTCPTQKNLWSCRIPAGRQDLRLSAAGYITQYRWDVEVPRHGTVELETLHLRQGAAVSGWVEAETAEPAKGAEVALSPRSLGGHTNAVDRARMNRLTLSATANHRGFFQIGGVAPGEYVIEARMDPFAPARATVQVFDAAETLVADPPLVLHPPQVIEAFVAPPVPPEGEQWTIRVAQLDRNSHAMRVLDPTPVSFAGYWSSEPLAPGRYWLTLDSDGTDGWFAQELELDPDTTPVFIELPVVRIRGTVLWGEDPIPASVWFGGKKGAVSVKLDADADGRFEGFLPRPGRWNIDVDGAEGPVRRSFQREIIKRPGKGYAELELRVPNTRLECLVVHESGAPAPGAIVEASSQEEVASVRERSDDEGFFAIEGLPPGLVTVKAEAAGPDQSFYSDDVPVKLEDGEEPELVKLVLRPELRIRGRVVADADGHGVPGARIKAEPCPMLGDIILVQTTDAEGYFEVHLPFDTREFYLSVAAPGYAFEFLRLPADPDRSLIIPVGWASGTLVVDLPATFDRDSWDSAAVLLYREGAREHLWYLLGWWGRSEGTSREGANRFILPSMKPGRYHVCLADRHAPPTFVPEAGSGHVCVAGNLPESGELEISLPPIPGP